jgi:antirestriction protein ArdC
MRGDDRAIVRAASAASKAADYLLAFRSESDRAAVSDESADVLATELSLGVLAS